MKSIIQFIKFGIVGASNTIISYVTYILLLRVGMYYLIASIISFVVSVLNSYFWNNRYVFKSEEGKERIWWKVLFKTFISYAGTGLVLSNILLILWVEVICIPKELAPLINLVITIPLNYIVNKFWAYKDSKVNDKEGASSSKL